MRIIYCIFLVGTGALLIYNVITENIAFTILSATAVIIFAIALAKYDILRRIDEI